MIARGIDIEQDNLFSNYWSMGLFEKYFYQHTKMEIFLGMTMRGRIKTELWDTLVQGSPLIVEKSE